VGRGPAWKLLIISGMTKKNGKWTVLDTEKKFENEFFTVLEDKVLKPDGQPGTYAMINYKPGVSILPIDEKDNIYLTSQFRYALGRKDLEVASGAMDEGEEPLEAAKREVKEELGISAGTWAAMGWIQSDTSITNSKAYLFTARHLRFDEPEREVTEDIETVRMPLAEAYQKVTDGEITHDQTVVLILKAYMAFQRF
jgi:8-oxo-dGTP pyrophosphatase MutT (NUDIX family)